MRNKQGFSLVEVMVVAAILVIAIIGLIQIFISASMLFESSGNMTIALINAKSKLEEMRNESFSQITTNYGSGGTPGNTFDLNPGTGKGVIYIDSSNSNLFTVTIAVSWRNQNGRIIGEDADLDGSLDAGEDTNGDGQLSSPVTIRSLIARR